MTYSEVPATPCLFPRSWLGSPNVTASRSTANRSFQPSPSESRAETASCAPAPTRFPYCLRRRGDRWYGSPACARCGVAGGVALRIIGPSVVPRNTPWLCGSAWAVALSAEPSAYWDGSSGIGPRNTGCSPNAAGSHRPCSMPFSNTCPELLNPSQPLVVALDDPPCRNTGKRIRDRQSTLTRTPVLPHPGAESTSNATI